MPNKSISILAWIALTIAAFPGPSGLPVVGQEQKPGVSLILSKASVQTMEKEIHFRCAVVLDNATGKDITLRSTFSSIYFDGLELVITTQEGKTLVQQPYISHQSPLAPQGLEATLKPGKIEGTLVFPIRGLPGGEKVVKVRLVGTLPGGEYERILSTETLEVRIKD